MIRCALVLLLAAGALQAQTFKYNFPINGSQAVPPNASAASGIGTVTIDTATNVFSWNVTWSGVAATAAHFHGPAAPGAVAGVQVGISSVSPSVGSTVISAVQENDLLNGLWYANIHSAAFPGGEIRGQVYTQWEDVGFAKPGTGGIAPILAASGVLAGGTANSVVLANALPASTWALFVGVNPINAPFKGGTLVPAPTILLVGLPTGPTGTFTLPFMWPSTIPPGTMLWWQGWVTDPGATKNLSATNGVRSTST